MSNLLTLKSYSLSFALIAAVCLTASSRLFAEDGIVIGHKCEAHAKEWDQLQADKKFSLENTKDKDDLASVQAYYAKKEALLLRKMFLCDHCKDKVGKIEDLPSTGTGGEKSDPSKGKEVANGLELVGILEREMTEKSRVIAADRSHPKFASAWNNRRIPISSVIKIDGEEMELDSDTGVATPVGRGFNKTAVQAHAVGAKIYLVKRAVTP